MQPYTNAFNFQPGKRYRIVYRTPTQRYDRVCVMDYLGSSGITGELGFSARPVAGTQQMPRSWIKLVKEVSTPVYMNRRYSGS